MLVVVVGVMKVHTWAEHCVVGMARRLQRIHSPAGGVGLWAILDRQTIQTAPRETDGDDDDDDDGAEEEGQENELQDFECWELWKTPR